MMTVKDLIHHEDDKTLLDIHEELHSCVIPATGYAHQYVRKVNHMIDQGKLKAREDNYRHVYIKTVGRMVESELANRYATYCSCAKGPEEF